MTDLTNEQTQDSARDTALDPALDPDSADDWAENRAEKTTESIGPVAAPAGKPARLCCEYQLEPLGIDVLQPRLSWWPGDDRPAELQTAYQILAASHPELLRMDEGDLWDSGRVEGRETVQLEYKGKPLISGRKVFWKVRSFDSDGLPSPWSDPASFEAGLLEARDWSGRWISAGQVGSRINTVPVPLFGRTFTLKQPVRRARLYVAVRGQAALQLNGQSIGAHALPAGWVDYSKRVTYHTLDVTDDLLKGENRLAVLLADGCYAGNPGVGGRQQYGDRPELLVELRAGLEDGSQWWMSTDSGWRWQPSWILLADPASGEAVDGARRREDWLGDGPGSFGWYAVNQGARPEEEEVRLCPIRKAGADGDSVEGEMVRWQDTSALFEFPQPLLGHVRLALKAPDGGAFRIRYALALDESGEPIGLGEDAYVASGDEAGESFEAHFSLHGFRYAEVSGDLYREDSVRAFAVPAPHQPPLHSSLSSDHPRLNQLADQLSEHLRRVQAANSMPGLAPQDRLGRISEVGPTAASLLLCFDGVTLVSTWLEQMTEAQFPDGSLPTAVPAPPAEDALCTEGPAGSSAALVECLWLLFRASGDRKLLRKYYPAARRVLASGLGAADEFVREDLDADPAYPADLLATAWLYRTARMTARIAGVLGNLSDLENCEELAGNIRHAFRRRFVTPDGRLVGDGAHVCALVLHFGLLDRKEQRRARTVLIDAVETTLSAGSEAMNARRDLLGVPWLLASLNGIGRLDLAYRLLLETPVHPDPAQGGRDLNQLIVAGVLEWLMSSLAGFKYSRDLSENHIAYRHMIIEPKPPLGVGFGSVADEPPVRAVESSLITVNGRYESSWQLTEEAFEVTVLIPGNCSAEVNLPDGSSHVVDAGRHTLRMSFGEAGDGIPVLREVS
jgi:alpha-L-rhamnosidase